MNHSYSLDWGRKELIGNPRNRIVIFRHVEERFEVSISVQDFSVPGFTKPPRVPDRTIYLSCVLRGRKWSNRDVYIFRTIGEDTLANREKAEQTMTRLLYAKNKCVNKRPKESEKFLNSLA